MILEEKLFQRKNLTAFHMKKALIHRCLYLQSTLIPCHTLFVPEQYLKLVSTIFIKFLFFLPKDSPSKTMKNTFYFMKKALFVLEIIKFFYFRAPLFFSLSAIALEDDRR